MKFQKMSIIIYIDAPKLIFFNEIFFQKDSDNFWHRKVTLKVRNWHFFGGLVGLTTNWFNEEMLISNTCMHDFMCSAIKKSWKVSNIYLYQNFLTNKTNITYYFVFKCLWLLVHCDKFFHYLLMYKLLSAPASFKIRWR